MKYKLKIFFSIISAILAIVLIAGCTGNITSISDITDTSAHINADVACGDNGDRSANCYFYYQWGTNGQYQYKTKVYGPFGSTNGTLHGGYTITGLQPDTTYQVQLCGKGDGMNSGWFCGINSDKSFKTKPKPSPSPSSCSVQIFCGDFETGNLSQWTLAQYNGSPSGCGGPCTASVVGNTSINVVTNPVKQGTYAAKFRVQPCLSGCAKARAELIANQAKVNGYNGAENYYSWYTMFPSGQSFWSGGGDWNAIVQFTDAFGNYGNIVGIGINSADYPAPGHLQEEGIPNGRIDLGQVQFDHWYHFVLHVKLSTDPSVGFIELLIDGNTAIPLRHEQTLIASGSPQPASATGPGMSQVTTGYYSHASSDNTVYHDGFCTARTLADANNC